MAMQCRRVPAYIGKTCLFHGPRLTNMDNDLEFRHKRLNLSIGYLGMQERNVKMLRILDEC
jgi:hypothetical protein